MADPFTKVQPGQPIQFSAAFHNATVDTVNDFRRRQINRTAPDETLFRQGDIVKVWNQSGQDLNRFSVLGLSGPIFDPATNATSLLAFVNQVAFTAGIPDNGHRGKFAILLDPALSGAVKRAWVSGVCPVQINVVDADHTCADVLDGETGFLQTRRGGAAQILWRQPGLGLVWGYVRFSSTCGGSSASGDTPNSRCDCPEDSYEIDVDCFGCAYGYGPTTSMPRYWILTILSSESNPYAEEPYCDVDCPALEGQVVQLANETTTDPYSPYTETGSCVWSGRNGLCLQGELTGTDETVTLRLLDSEDCVIATFTMPAADFNCCGPNTAWEQDATDECTMTVSLAPHPCTCCPEEPYCPPPGRSLCEGIDCCLIGCTISVTVTSLATPPSPDPPNPLPPENACGGMNGVYACEWVSDCTWFSRGLPGSQASPAGITDALLTYNAATGKWTFRLDGPDGQVAIFTHDDPWDCVSTVLVLDLVLASSTCLVGGQASVPLTVT